MKAYNLLEIRSGRRGAISTPSRSLKSLPAAES